MTRTSGRPALLATLPLVLAFAACSPPEAGVARGEAVFNTCVPCHGAAGQGNFELGAPAIAGLPAWYVDAQLEKFEAGWRGAHPQDTVGIRMKSMARALDLEVDRESVAAFVATLPVVPSAVTVDVGDASQGETYYRQTCIGCHGPEALGMEIVWGPPLIHLEDWYFVNQFQKFRRGWRGAHPEDVFGQTMAANAQEYDDVAVLDILAYIRTLQ